MIICFFGDSILAGAGDEESLGWPARLCARARRAGHSVTGYNLGVNAETAGDIARRWCDEYRRRCPAGLLAATVFGFGSNDATLEEDGSPRLTCDESLDFARNMLSEALTLGPVLWIGPTPIDEAFQPRRVATGELRSKRNAVTAAYNEAYREAAAELSVPFLDLFAALEADPRWLRQLHDGVHPNAAGYDRLADLIGAWAPWRDLTEGRR